MVMKETQRHLSIDLKLSINLNCHYEKELGQCGHGEDVNLYGVQIRGL